MSTKNKFRKSCVLSLFALIATPFSVDAGYAIFDEITDTISIAGNTSLATATTWEAVIRPRSNNPGVIWNEWQSSVEDKQFGLTATGGVYGYSNIVGTGFAAGTTAVGAWHRLAYVCDGAQERIYVDGALVTSRNVGGDIPDGASSIMVVGAIIRNSAQTLYHTFIGDIDSLRISQSVRYSGPRSHLLTAILRATLRQSCSTTSTKLLAQP
jgi:hypothetical protein